MMAIAGLQQVAAPYRFLPTPPVNQLDPMQLMGVLAHGQAMQLAQANTGVMGLGEREAAAQIEKETGVSIDPYARQSVNVQSTQPTTPQNIQTEKQRAAERAYLLERMQRHSQNIQTTPPQSVQVQPDPTIDTSKFLQGVRGWGED